MFCPKAERQAACCNVTHAWCDIFMTYVWQRSCDIYPCSTCLWHMPGEIWTFFNFIVGLLGWLDGLMSSVPKAHFSRPSDLFESSLTERNWTWTRWRPHLSDGCFSATINAMIACSGWRLSSLSLVRSYHRRAQPFVKTHFCFCFITSQFFQASGDCKRKTELLGLSLHRSERIIHLKPATTEECPARVPLDVPAGFRSSSEYSRVVFAARFSSFVYRWPPGPYSEFEVWTLFIMHADEHFVCLCAKIIFRSRCCSDK